MFNLGALGAAVTLDDSQYRQKLQQLGGETKALLGKVAGFVASIPTAVIGGVSIVLFGSIAAVGIRNLVENKVDFTDTDNILTVAVILVLGLGMGTGVKLGSVTISGLFVAALVGVLMNLLFTWKKQSMKVSPATCAGNQE